MFLRAVCLAATVGLASMKSSAAIDYAGASAAAQELARANGWDGRFIGEPMPAGERLYTMAREMGKPVARGLLPLEEAFAACIAATVKAERDGQIGGYKATDIVRFQRWLVQESATKETQKRDLTAHRIRRLLRPMIAIRKPSRVLLAEAHGVNGADGFPLAEPEVTDIVAMLVWQSMPAAPRGMRRG